MTIRVCCDDCRMTRKMLFAKGHTQLLRFFHSQSVIRLIPWVKGNDVVMRFDFFRLPVGSEFAVGTNTGHSKIFFSALQRADQVILPKNLSSLGIQKRNIPKGVMLEDQIALSSRIIRALGADMLYGRHRFLQSAFLLPAGRLSARSTRSSVPGGFPLCVCRRNESIW